MLRDYPPVSVKSVKGGFILNDDEQWETGSRANLSLFVRHQLRLWTGEQAGGEEENRGEELVAASGSQLGDAAGDVPSLSLTRTGQRKERVSE